MRRRYFVRSWASFGHLQSSGQPSEATYLMMYQLSNGKEVDLLFLNSLTRLEWVCSVGLMVSTTQIGLVPDNIYVNNWIRPLCSPMLYS